VPQWNIEHGMCRSIECDSASFADEIRARLESCNIRCHSDQNRVIIAEPNDWVEIIAASEPFIGTCLISSNQGLTATAETPDNSGRPRRRVLTPEQRKTLGF
jgi:hypothetical protein